MDDLERFLGLLIGGVIVAEIVTHPEGLLEVSATAGSLLDDRPRPRAFRRPVTAPEPLEEPRLDHLAPEGARALPHAHAGTVEWRGDEVVLPDPYIELEPEWAGPPTLRDRRRWSPT